MVNSRKLILRYAFHLMRLYVIIAAFGGTLFSVLYSFVPIPYLLVAGSLKDIILILLVFADIFVCICDVVEAGGKLILRRRLWKLLKPLVFFTVIFMISCLKSKAPFNTLLLIFRRYYLPLVTIFFFIQIGIDECRFDRFVAKICIVLSLFGLVEYFLLPTSFWDTVVRLPHYWIESGDRWGVESVANSGRFYTYDLYVLLGHTARRMVSFFAEPTNFSSFMISAFIILKDKKAIRILCLICCALAVSKAALVGLLGLYPILVVYDRLSLKHNYSFLYIMMFLCFFFVAAAVRLVGYVDGAFSHTSGYYTGVLSVLNGNIWGYGIGSAGNYSVYNEEFSAIGGESGIGGMLAQCGIGAYFYFYFFNQMIKILQADFKKNFRYIVLIFVWTVICMFSESAFGASGNILFFVYSAIAVNRQMNDIRYWGKWKKRAIWGSCNNAERTA